MSTPGSVIYFAPQRVPVADKNGLITREWYLFFQALWLRTGGDIAPSTNDVLTSLPQGLGVAELQADSFNQAVAFGSDPPVVQLEPIDLLIAEVSNLQAQLAEVMKQLDGLRSSGTQLV